jgi:hypothetical protein
VDRLRKLPPSSASRRRSLLGMVSLLQAVEVEGVQRSGRRTRRGVLSTSWRLPQAGGAGPAFPPPAGATGMEIEVLEMELNMVMEKERNIREVGVRR